MKNFSLIILIVAFLFVGCDNQTNERIDDSNNSKERVIQNLINDNIDSCVVKSLNNVLEIEIFSPPKELMVGEKNNLIADSILLLIGNKLWDYTAVNFNFMMDTTKKEDLKYFQECESLNQNEKSLLACVVTRSMSQDNLMQKAEKFNSKTYMKFFRTILNTLSAQELKDYQKSLEFMNSRFPEKFTDNFITTVLDLGYKYDEGQDFSKEVFTLRKLKEISELMIELDIHINMDVLEEIMTTTNKT